MSATTVQQAVWIPCRPDTELALGVASILNEGPELFAVRAAAGDRPVDAIFALEAIDERERARTGTVKFRWTHRRGFELPSMRGAIAVRRLGLLSSIHIRATYDYDNGPAGRLFHQAVGEQLGRKTFEQLIASIKLLAKAKGVNA